MKGVILDFDSLAATDLDLQALDASLDAWQRHPCTGAAETLQRIRGFDVVLTNKVVLGEEHFRACPELKLVIIMATGTNNVDLVAARRHGIPVCNISAYSTPSVVQYTFAVMLALRTRLPEYTRDVRAGRWQASRFFGFLDYPIHEVAGSALGIVGYGAIGQAVAQVAMAFGMQVLVAESLTGQAPAPGTVARLPLTELLPQVDVLSLHCPLTEQTRNLVDAAALARMKPSAILINAARGGIVDEQALADALRAGRLAAAAVDVLTREPPADDHPLLAADIPNLLLTPHIGWASREARQRLVDRMVRILASFRAGGPLEGCVNAALTLPG